MSLNVTRAATRARRAACLVVLGLAVACAAPSLDDALVHDDVVLVGQDPRVTGPIAWRAIWTTDYWPGDRASYLYRPVTTSSVALLAGGGRGQRVANVALHAAVSLLVLALLVECGLRLEAATVGAALFACHPIHAEAIHLVVGRAEMLAAAFGLAFILVLRRPGPWAAAGSGVLLALALGSKESAVMLPALALVLSPLRRPGVVAPRLAREAVRMVVVSVPGVLALLLARRAIFGTLLAPPGFVSELYNPLAPLEPGWRALNAAWLMVAQVGSMLLPVGLSVDHSLGSLRLLASVTDARVAAVVGLSALLALALAWPRARRMPELRGLAFALVALLPVSNLAFVAGVARADRLAYLPSAGTCLLLAAAWQRWAIRGVASRRAAWAAAAIALAAAGVACVVRGAAWQGPESFTRALVREAPGSAPAHGWRAAHLQGTGRLHEAEAEVRRALEIAPRWSDAWDTLGELLAARGDLRGAGEAWSRAAREAAASETDVAGAAPLHFRAAQAFLAAGECARAREESGACRAALANGAPEALLALERRMADGRCANGDDRR